MRALTTGLLAATLLLAVAGPRAGHAAEDDVTVARDHYRRGTKLFDLRHFPEAAKEFEAAYEAKDDPVFLYNIAQAHRLAGNSSDAVGAYQSYLRRAPKAPNRQEVMEHIHELQALIDQQRRTQESTPVGTLPSAVHDGREHPRGGATNDPSATASVRPGRRTTREPVSTETPATATPTTQTQTQTQTQSATATSTDGAASEPSTAHEGSRAATGAGATAAVSTDGSAPTASGGEADRAPGASGRGRGKVIGGAVVLALGVALVGVGIAEALSAMSASDELTNAHPGQVFNPDTESSGSTAQTIAIASLAVGGAAIVTGAVVLGLGMKERRSSTLAIAPSFSHHGAGAVLAGRF